MEKIGFIDYYIDEWHANNYPQMIRDSEYKDRFDVSYAWEQYTPEGKTSINEWCSKNRVNIAETIEEVVEKSDCIVVLSPDNSEKHEELADLPLKSGKPVYIDKPVAPDLPSALRLFDKADEYKTPIMSCSALRFSNEIKNLTQTGYDANLTEFAQIRGAGNFKTYAIHQIEMLVMLMGTHAREVFAVKNNENYHYMVKFNDQRSGTMTQLHKHPFQFSLVNENLNEKQALNVDNTTDFFENFIDGMLSFFDTGKSLFPSEETKAIAAIFDACGQALDNQNTWVKVPSWQAAGAAG